VKGTIVAAYNTGTTFSRHKFVALRAFTKERINLDVFWIANNVIHSAREFKEKRTTMKKSHMLRTVLLGDFRRKKCDVKTACLLSLRNDEKS
jgi:hypothetical protein